MSKPINLCYPTLSRYDLLAQSIESATKSTLRPTLISVVDNGGKFAENFGDISEVDGIPLKVYVPGINIGVGRAWNYFFNTCEDDIVICNDDTLLKDDTLELLIKASNDNPNEIFFTPDNYWEHYFSFYHLRKNAWTSLGEFDNNLICYFEDRCMTYRMKLRGYKPFVVKNCTYTHIEGGSNSMKIAEDKTAIHEQFVRSQDYYLKKWNGMPGNERFTKPFGIMG